MSKILLKGSKKIKISESVCILCDNKCSEKCRLSLTSWKALREKAKLWVGLDRFGECYENVSWDKPATDNFLHQSCKLQIYSKRLLEQALKRKKKNDNEPSEAAHKQSEIKPSQNQSTRVPTRETTGELHKKDCCIWCMKPEDKRHKGRNESELFVLQVII